jgi:hypothetical protein
MSLDMLTVDRRPADSLEVARVILFGFGRGQQALLGFGSHPALLGDDRPQKCIAIGDTVGVTELTKPAGLIFDLYVPDPAKTPRTCRTPLHRPEWSRRDLQGKV